jgi:hypothetical protein
MPTSNPLIASVERVHERVLSFKERARRFFYAVVLSPHCCGACGGRLEWAGAGRAKCGKCGVEFDLTVTFQRSECCRATLELKRQHYACSRCGQPVVSRFLFDERVFDAEYFRDAMKRSREKKSRRLARLKELLAASRSDALVLADLPLLDEVPGLAEDLDALVGSISQVDAGEFREADDFVLEAYREAILEYLGGLEVMFSAFPVLCEDSRVDRARRFVTLVYMEHEGDIVLTQYGNDILVEKNEADVKG